MKTPSFQGVALAAGDIKRIFCCLTNPLKLWLIFPYFSQFLVAFGTLNKSLRFLVKITPPQRMTWVPFAIKTIRLIQRSFLTKLFSFPLSNKTHFRASFMSANRAL